MRRDHGHVSLIIVLSLMKNDMIPFYFNDTFFLLLFKIEILL